MKTSSALALVLMAVLFTGSVIYIYYSGLVEEWKAKYEQLQQAQEAVVTPVDLDITVGNSTFDFSANITSTGTSTANTTTTTLTVENDDEKTATYYFTLKNPKTGEDGLPADLENEYFKVYIQSGSTKKFLYDEKAYTNGTDTFTLSPHSIAEYTLGMIVEKSTEEDSFTDNGTYSVELYVYQPAADYVQTVDLTVLT